MKLLFFKGAFPLRGNQAFRSNGLRPFRFNPLRAYVLPVTVLAALCALTFCACAPKKPAMPSAVQNGNTPKAVRIVLDWTPNTNHTGLYVALENGYFEQAGFNVTILQPPEDGALVLVAAGGAEYGVDFQETMGPAIARKTDPLPITAVAAIINHNTSGIMSLAHKNILAPRDLAGKRFGSWETPLVTEITRAVVEGDGGDFSAVKMIPNFATDAISALQTDIDAIWIYYAWDGIKAELENIPINYIDFGTVNPVFDFYTPVLVANSAYIREHTEDAKNFMAAVRRGYEYAIENPQQAAQILLKNAPELDARLVHKSQLYLATRYAPPPPQGETRWGFIDSARWSAFYGWMYEKGLLERDIRGGGFTNDLLN